MAVAAMTAQDRADVIELIGSYPQYLDSAQLDVYVANFAPDGVLDGSLPHIGRDAIRQYVKGLIDVGRVGPNADPPMMHFMGLPQIEGDSERCTARAYLLWFKPTSDGGTTATGLGIYMDSFSKIDGRWYIQKRTIRELIGTH